MVIIIPQPITLCTLYSLWLSLAHQTTRVSSASTKNKENWQIPSREWRNDSALPYSPYVVHRQVPTSCAPCIKINLATMLLRWRYKHPCSARDLFFTTQHNQPTVTFIQTKLIHWNFIKFMLNIIHASTHIRTYSPTHKNKKLSSDVFLVVVGENMLLPMHCAALVTE